MRKTILLAICAVALLNGCASNDLEKKCSETVARSDCPAGTAGKMMSEYDNDLSGMDDQRCRVRGPVGSEAYLQCRREVRRDRRN
ncbi:MAG TPA: hypothetical protein VFW22_03550 [Pseudolabrys sp.]|nr:hypothetical protein [Pseudolabrys sp.]